MKEKLIASLQIACEPGLPLSLRYYLLEEVRGSGALYGIKVVEETTRAAAVAPGVTRNRQYASELIARLAGEGVRACLKSIETPSQSIFFRRRCVGLT